MACSACRFSFFDVVDLLTTSSRKTQIESESHNPDLRRYIGHSRVHAEARIQLECRCSPENNYRYVEERCQHIHQSSRNTRSSSLYEIQEEEVIHEPIKDVQTPYLCNVSFLTEQLSQAAAKQMMSPVYGITNHGAAGPYNPETSYESAALSISTENKAVELLDTAGDVLPQVPTYNYPMSCSSEVSSPYVCTASVSVCEVDDD